MSIRKLSQQSAMKVASAYQKHVIQAHDGLSRFEGFQSRFTEGEHKLVLCMAGTEHQVGVDHVVLCGWDQYDEIVPSLNAVYSANVY